MIIDDKLLDKVETLAYFNYSENERPQVISDFAAVFKELEALDGLDTGGAEPLIYLLDKVNVFREDLISQKVSAEELLNRAPEAFEGYFVVPQTFD